MATDDFFRARLDQMIDLNHPLAQLSRRIPWPQIEAALAPSLAHKDRFGRHFESSDLLGATMQVVGAGVSAAGRPRVAVRLMAALLYLKHAFNLSDEQLVERWSENVVWQYFSGQQYYEHKLPCDASQIGRFRKAIGEAGVAQLLKATIDTALDSKAIAPKELERVIVAPRCSPRRLPFPPTAGCWRWRATKWSRRPSSPGSCSSRPLHARARSCAGVPAATQIGRAHV